MATPKRIYLLAQKDKPDRLVDAVSPSQVIRHASAGMFEVHAADTREVAACMAAGIVIESVAEPATAADA